MKFNLSLAQAVIGLVCLANPVVAMTEVFKALDYFEGGCKVTIYYPGIPTGIVMDNLVPPGEVITVALENGKVYAKSNKNCKFEPHNSEGNPWPSGLRIRAHYVRPGKRKVD
ncbi:hypothetical protein PpBr36_00655 [Pyricularia pennisetigena]|uniref:hypothetical protein n=1 Tax=Pyricularia pennisetigena TaxID=1578925 RepID=UPI00114F2C63|nr:hypothetical protein PpBr36_00655 [Pyricularia pennisetigena]TLS28497.1 hypothetical protein PpBr36_00655 [Pyricularia pennisetigena]